MRFTMVRVIAADHPSLAGHFPTEPIVPGVVILDEVLQAVRAWRGPYRLIALPTVKFLFPLRPEQAFAIHLTCDDEGNRVKFECWFDDRLIVQGQLAISL
jgi:3-hydroxyacyl-[acyl-carrier-protein] dehydratase